VKSSGEALSVSYTVATLDARSEFARLREMLGSVNVLDGCLADAPEELDRLVDVLTDAYKRVDGMVTDETYMAVEQERDSYEEDLRDQEGKTEEKEEEVKLLETRIEELEEAAAEEDPESLQAMHAAALRKVASCEKEIARLQAINVKRNAPKDVITGAFAKAAVQFKRSKVALEALHMAEEEIVKLRPDTLK
jgi:chromosome segregation ATPase